MESLVRTFTSQKPKKHSCFTLRGQLKEVKLVIVDSGKAHSAVCYLRPIAPPHVDFVPFLAALEDV